MRGLLEPYRSMGGDGLNLDNLSTIRAIAIQTDLDLSDGPIDGVEIEDVVIDEVPVRLYRPPAEDELPLHVYSSDTMVLRPTGGGRSRALDLGAGDLLVMGGTCQSTWEHALPKVAHAGLRISVQLRSAPVVAARY